MLIKQSDMSTQHVFLNVKNFDELPLCFPLSPTIQ